MKIPIVNRRQFIKTAAASTLLLSNIDLSRLNSIFSTCNADIRKNQLTGLTMQNTRPKAPLVSVYGLGYEGTRSVKSLADKVDIPDIEVEMRDGTIHEGHLNFLIMGYRYWMESNLDEMLEHYHEIGNLKIAVVGVSVNGQGMCLGNEALKKLTELTTIFDTVLLVPDLRMEQAAIPSDLYYSHSEFLKREEFLADTVLEISYKMLDGGYIGPDLVDLDRCLRKNAIACIGTGIAWGGDRGEIASAKAYSNSRILINNSIDSCDSAYLIASSSNRNPGRHFENAIEFVDEKLKSNADLVYGHYIRKSRDNRVELFIVTLVLIIKGIKPYTLRHPLSV